MRNFLALAAAVAFALFPSFSYALGEPGTVYQGQGPSLPTIWTPTPQLGVSGTTGGAVLFQGVTSGQVTLKPTDAAGSSVTLTLPAATDTLVGKATTDTLTNKTLTSPTLTSPSLGVATATSLNGNTFTTGTYTLTGVAAKTLTFSNTLTLAGTDGQTETFPAVSDTMAGLATAQTFTALQTITNSDIALLGSSTGKTTFTSANAGSSNFTLTIPASTGTATVVGTPVACGGTCTLGAANLNTYTRLDTAAGSVATLPGATGSGATYKMYISVATTSNSDKVLTNPTTDTIIGTAQGENAGTAKVFVGNAGTYHSLQMPFAGSQPSGGFIGDTVVCTDVASTIWKCDIQYQGGTTPTTPYSASTS